MYFNRTEALIQTLDKRKIVKRLEEAISLRENVDDVDNVEKDENINEEGYESENERREVDLDALEITWA